MKNLIQSVLILIAVLKSTAGAEEVIVYAQVGQTITLRPPAGALQQYYLYWLTGDLELAWRNIHGGLDVAKMEGQGKCKPDSNKNRCDEVKKWVNKLSLSEDILTIKGIQQEHFGTFVCRVTKGTGTVVATATYKVLKLNVAVNPPSPLLPGESLSLICDAESPRSGSKPQIYWLNPQGEKITNKPTKITGQHNGQWTCVVTSDGKEHKATVSITVVDLSLAPVRPQFTSKSSPLTIPCSFPNHISWGQINATGIRGGKWTFVPKQDSSLSSSEPQTLFSLSLENPPAWKAVQKRGLTPAPDLKKGKLSLTKNRGSEDDKGAYTCTLNFRNGVTLERTVHVEVLQIISSRGTEFISGQQLNLTCGIGSPLPSDLQLKWVPPEHSSLPLLSASDPHPAQIIIPEVGTGDSGKWRCELWQRDTKPCLTSAVITLKIEPKLSVWMLVIISGVTVIVFLLLLILVFVLCRRRQRKMTHLRHRLCQCKNPKPKGFYRT